MKNVLLKDLTCLIGQVKAPNLGEDFIFGRQCILVKQTRLTKWWASLEEFNRHNYIWR